MIYKYDLVVGSCNKITHELDNLLVRVGSTCSENVLLLLCRYSVQYLGFQLDLCSEKKVPWYIQEHALPTCLVRGVHASTILHGSGSDISRTIGIGGI
jgi:hypothetical protein